MCDPNKQFSSFQVFRSIPCLPKNANKSQSSDIAHPKSDTSDILKAKVEDLLNGKDKRSIYDDRYILSVLFNFMLQRIMTNFHTNFYFTEFAKT